MKQGFTLMELQASMVLGVVVCGLAFLLLRFEMERSLRVESLALLRNEARKLDGTLQFLLQEGETLQWTENGFLLLGKGDRQFVCHSNNLSWDRRPFLHPDLGFRLELASVHNSEFQLRLALFTPIVEESYVLKYLLPSALWVQH